MSGYYEWHYDEPENRKKKGQPYYFTAADGTPILTAAESTAGGPTPRTAISCIPAR
jgi:hypothetical protein